jgi:arylformamidase
MHKLYDVTVLLSADVPTYPGDPPFRSEFVHSISAGDPCNLTRLSMGAHSGTHVDAPYHFLADGATVDQLPLEILIGKARVIGMTALERIDRADLERVDLRDDIRVPSRRACRASCASRRSRRASST